jgi:hypothetical protein
VTQTLSRVFASGHFAFSKGGAATGDSLGCRPVLVLSLVNRSLLPVTVREYPDASSRCQCPTIYFQSYFRTDAGDIWQVAIGLEGRLSIILFHHGTFSSQDEFSLRLNLNINNQCFDFFYFKILFILGCYYLYCFFITL